MKRLFLFIPLMMAYGYGLACDACERRQLPVLSGLTHGAGPASQWDYLIVSVAMAIVGMTLWLSVKWLVKPGERSAQHIKNSILNS